MIANRLCCGFLAIFFALCAPVALGQLVIRFDGIEGGPNDLGNLSQVYGTWSVASALSGNFSEGQCGEIMIEKEVDRASVKFVEAAVFGTLFAKAEIHNLLFFQGSGPEPFKPQTAFELKNAKIISVEASKPENAPLREILSIQTEEIQITFTEYDRDGQPLGGNTQASFVCGNKVK